MNWPVFHFALRYDISDQPQFLPRQGEPLATGWDVFAAPVDRNPIILRAGQYVKIPLGIRAFSPDSWWLQLNPRSSTFAKKSLHALYGVIDSSYEGELTFVAQYQPDVRSLGTDLVINFGDAVGQLIPVPRQQMSVVQITNTEFDDMCRERGAVRGAGGFGSTTGGQ